MVTAAGTAVKTPEADEGEGGGLRGEEVAEEERTLSASMRWEVRWGEGSAERGRPRN